jgi:Family of unknown function (DUF5678)
MPTKSLTEVRKSPLGRVDFSKEAEWLKQHRQTYIGQWIVLDGDRLVGHGKDPVPIVAQARAEGVRIPFVEFIRDESEPFCGGWM